MSIDDLVMRDPLGALVPDGALDRSGRDGGALSGLTFAVKDLFDVAGISKTCGSRDWARTQAAAGADAPVVRACLDAGARLVGRTVMDELAYGLTGRNPYHGAPANPNAPGRFAGGSSCGSAAAVAGGLADFALGTDTGGSVRVPASYCGLFGLRPTHGAVDLAGAMALAPSFDTCGWFAREAGVLSQIGEVLLPPAPDDLPATPTGMVIAEDAWALAVPRANAALLAWIERLRPRLGDGEAVCLAEDGETLADWRDCFRMVQSREAYLQFADWVARDSPSFGPEMAKRWAFASSLNAEAAAAAGEGRRRHRARLEALTAGGRVICVPCAPDVAPMLSADETALADHRDRVLALTAPAGLAGLPQIALPVATVDGVPLGLGLIGPRGGDRMLLDFAVALCGTERRDPGARFDTA